LVARLGSEQFELLGERRLPIAGVFRLLLAHHVNHLDSTQDHTGSDRRLETEHRSDPSLDGAVVLLNAIVQVGTLPETDGFQVTPRSVLETVCGIAGQDRLAPLISPSSEISCLLPKADPPTYMEAQERTTSPRRWAGRSGRPEL
jgi:hypothetical protein